MNHYFTDNRHLVQNRKEITFRFSCFTCHFLTDNGVFCKDHVDFGTRTLLDAVHASGLLGEEVLDLGCGYGVIGITLKKQYPDSAFTLAEVNPRALELAQENAARNGAEVTCVCSDVYSGVEGNTFTDILTNPPIRAGKKVIYQMFEQAYDHLREGGRLWVVIRKQQGAASAREKIAQVFGSCEIISREKGYLVLLAKKVDKLTGD